tara:strand:- start:32 stop:355 length:324 start_codon:yes stop_codon:yes gene_type:complete
MIYLFLYVVAIASFWWISRVGWLEALKTMVKILIPSTLIILFNLKAGRLLFRNPIVGIISVLPTAVFIFKLSEPLVVSINSWIDKKKNDFFDMEDVVEAEVISKEDT